VQGLGNVGYHIAKFLSEEDGCRVTAVIERDGVVRNPDGLNIELLKSYIIETGGVMGFDGGTYHADGAAALCDDCDILVPAAREGVIDETNAGQVKAKLVVEAANGPVTAGADAILTANGVAVIPDLYANAGGVVVSYFEWVKNLTHIPFGLMERRSQTRDYQTLVQTIEGMTGRSVPVAMKDRFAKGKAEIDLVRSGLEEIMRLTFDDILAEHAVLMREKHPQPTLRLAAYRIAIDRISQAYQAIGI
jgi:glutamate dehydrogenase (NAD(P)+)